MSFPVARPDRRLLPRLRCGQLCLVQSGALGPTPARLLQLDPLGARLRLLAPHVTAARELRITLDGGGELFGDATWRIGDTIGVRRRARTPERPRDAAGLEPG
jgi:hypothetical protein